jgi:hypothetical protein
MKDLSDKQYKYLIFNIYIYMMDPILVSQILKERRKRARLANPRLNQSSYFKKWYANNRDNMILYYQNYYDENADSLIEKAKEYYQTNKESILEKNKLYHERNKDAIKEQRKQTKSITK